MNKSKLRLPADRRPAEDGENEVYGPRNFFVLILYHVTVRTAWIFKTESIIMPAIMDSIGGEGWLRGCLPMLNRLGQSIPPLLVSDRIRKVRKKKRLLASCAALMGVCFLILALTWFGLGDARPGWLPYFFLLIYAFFWLCVGLHNLSLNLLHGKLVAVTSRGRLMLIATTIGAGTAIVSAWFLMKPWLAADVPQFTLLFIATGGALVFAGWIATCMKEHPEQEPTDSKSLAHMLKMSGTILKRDHNFRLLAWIAGCYGMSITLFPHYQAYVRGNLELGLDALVPWVIVQNLGAAAFSIPLGRIADRFGNRLALQTAMILICLAPLLTIACVHLPFQNRSWGFYLVFFLLGLTPVSMRTFSNYTLEIASGPQQPIYLSTLGLCLAMPAVLCSAFIGALVDWVNFETVFGTIVAIVFVGWTLTFKLDEPRTLDQENQSERNRQSIGLE